VRRLIVALLASLILAGLVVPAAGLAVGAAPVAAAEAVPKVVIIVGPAGAATDRYRKEARSAAALARKYTPDVTELYSPNATWPAVKQALQGASLVIYMGHGNGWPSKYRDSLHRPSQNGFGLNPTAGGGDGQHQYYGEGKIAGAVTLAKNAVVLLNHLCYASGNTEPGLPEGTLKQARQRVDNYAAGFIAAGASAVIAEAYASPKYMVKTILGSDRSIESAWRNAPSRNGNAFAFPSARSAGYVAQMDPERGTSGFSRSIVLKAGLASADVLANARGSAAAIPRIDPAALVPSLIGTGVTLGEPLLDSSTSAGSTVVYKTRFPAADRGKLPDGLMASVRWDALDPVTAAPAADPPAADPAAATEGAATDPAATAPEATEADDGPPDLGLVTPERIGDLVAPKKLKVNKASLTLRATAPTTPGTYRLVVTLHDDDGVAYDAATQALLPALIVRVTGELDAQIVAPTTNDLVAGEASSLRLWVANLGTSAWGHAAIRDTKDPDGTAPATAARVVGQWIALGADAKAIAAAAAAGTVEATLPAGQEPDAVVDADLELTAPTVTGDYLLVLDVVTPEHGSLVASGVEPTVVRVSVAAASPAAPVATEAPAAEPAAPEGEATSDQAAAPNRKPTAAAQ
jgi:hypothetical protein